MIRRIFNSFKLGIRAARTLSKIQEGEYVIYCDGNERKVGCDEFCAKALVSHMLGKLTGVNVDGVAVINAKDQQGKPWVGICKARKSEVRKFFEPLSE